LCGGLRLLGFRLQLIQHVVTTGTEESELRANQFGLKHMLVWATALVPTLLVLQGFNILIFKRLGAHGAFSLTLVAVSIATINLIAIWAIVGGGRWIIRMLALLVVPFLLGIGTMMWMQYVDRMFRTNRWNLSRYDTLLGEIIGARQTWLTWLWLNAALLAALLLFLRAKGYRLIRKSRRAALAAELL
jgi:hypothetical protein